MTQVALSREETAINQLKTRFPEAIKETKVDRARRITIGFDSAHLIEIARFMRDELGFDHVKGIAGVDYPTHKRIELLYFTASFQNPTFKTLSLFSRPNCLVTAQ